MAFVKKLTNVKQCAFEPYDDIDYTQKYGTGENISVEECAKFVASSNYYYYFFYDTRSGSTSNCKPFRFQSCESGSIPVTGDFYALKDAELKRKLDPLEAEYIVSQAKTVELKKKIDVIKA